MKRKSIILVAFTLLLLAGCQTMEQVSISYLHPGEVSFPAQLRKIAVVNNTVEKPEVTATVSYGDGKITAESLAETLADQNYFDEIVICDSALRTNDRILRESTLSREEVNQLTTDLGVDCLISVEKVEMKVTRTVTFLEDDYVYLGATDVKTYPTFSVYIPTRNKPMTTIHSSDSIYWEVDGNTMGAVTARLIPDSILIREASGFAGTIPVRQLLPYKIQARRYLYTGGNVQMRDAAVYVRENSWDKAYELWQQVYNESKSDKKKMRAAVNIAVYYEMNDELAQAEEWATKAQEHAQKVDKTSNKVLTSEAPNYYFTSLYLNEIKERNSQLSMLKMQMNRFKDDF